MDFFEAEAAALAAAALGVLVVTDATMGEESESDDSLSSLKLDSESESFFFFGLAAFFVTAADLEAGFVAVDFAAGLPLDAAGAAFDATDGFFFEVFGLELPLLEVESESESESESDGDAFLETAAALGADVLELALLAVTGFADGTDGVLAAGSECLTVTAADFTAAVEATFAGTLVFAAITGGYTRPAITLGGPLEIALTVGVGETTAPTSSSNSIPISSPITRTFLPFCSLNLFRTS